MKKTQLVHLQDVLPLRLGDQKLDDQEFEIFLEYQPVFEQWQKMSSQVGSIFRYFFFYVWR